MASADLRDELNCSICLNIYTDPVNLKCGHNFCKLCIGNELDKQKESGIYSCPECRAEYRERPKLHKNTALCNIADRCRSTQQPENVIGITCTYCVHEILKYYCTKDSICICVSCSLAGEHHGHKVETVNEAHEKKKQRLRNAMDEQKTQREEAERQVQELTKHEKKVREKADSMKKKVADLIMDTRKQLEALEKKVLLEISMQEEQVSLRISDLIQQLEKKKSELSKEMGDIEELQNMTDPLAVLQAQESFSVGCGDALKEGQRHNLNVNRISKNLQTGLSGIINGLKRNQDIIKNTKTLLDINTSPDILLDVDTASNEVTVSSDLKTVSWTQQSQNRPETPERIRFSPQVLSTRSFTSGRHYWEVETSGDGWIIGMAYPSIDRKGGQSYSNYNAGNPQYFRGHNFAGIQPSQTYGIQTYMGDNKSWRLRLYNKVYSVMWGERVTQLNCRQTLQRIGIYLDFEAGQLSFYELSEPLTHIHTFTARFTEPLHVAICVWGNASVTIINGHRMGDIMGAVISHTGFTSENIYQEPVANISPRVRPPSRLFKEIRMTSEK
uniref:Uncharacterized protein n=1 Tax=Leptobrachium leishanense TaxID=445787 RepID=A0A8C5PWW0_9ANUR